MSGKIKSSMVAEPEKLEEMYHRHGMSLTDIGKQFGCSRQYVQLIFKELGIARRSQQAALRQSPRHRKSKHEFRPEHDRFILGNYDRMTDDGMARRLGKPVSSITYRRLVILRKKKVERRNFTPEENRFILRNYRRMTDTDIAWKLNRSLISITHHRNRILNRPKRDVRSYTEAEDRYIRSHYKVATDSELAAALRRSKASVAIHRNEVLGLGKAKGRKRRARKG